MKQILKKTLAIIYCMAIIVSVSESSFIIVNAASGITIQTTLVNNDVQKGSKKTFDVIARDSLGKKVPVVVTLNGATVSKNWDDQDKTSYTLIFTKEGNNSVVVSAGDTSLTYNITYKKAAKGDVIGKATISIELFTIGCGYLVEPTYVDIIEGENSSMALIRLLHKNGYVAFYGGSTDKDFYLAYIADGTNTEINYNGYNNSRNSGTLSSPKSLNFSPKIPSFLYPYLESSMNYFDEQDYSNWNGYIGEFVFTNGSGWMYCVNNVFPNVGFADTYLSDGDVVRVQYTLGYGSDIGGASAIGGNIPGAENQPLGSFFEVSDKDKLTSLMAQVNSQGLLNKSDVRSNYNSCMNIMKAIKATQKQVDSAYQALSSAVSKYIIENNLSSGTTNQSSTAQNEQSTNDSSNSNSDETDLSQNADDSSENVSDQDIIETDGTINSKQETNESKSLKNETNNNIVSSDKESTISWTWIVGLLLIIVAGATAYYIFYFKKKEQKKGNHYEDL